MKRAFASSALALSIVACGSSPPPEPMPKVVIPVAPPPAPSAAQRPARPREPSPEEKKKAEARAQLEKDRAEMLAAHKAELERWTPELREAAKALVSKDFPTGRAAIQAALASKHRRPGHAERDKYRRAAETMDFFGFKPTMTVLEYGPGEGWYTELLAPALAKKGKLVVTMGDPEGPKDELGTYYAERTKLLLESAPEIYGKVEKVIVDGKAPKLPMKGTLDMALVIRGAHGMQNSGALAAWLGEIHDALKPNGVLGIVAHRAKPDANAEESWKKGYLPEKWLVEKVEAAGFKLAGKSELNANPKDTKDYEAGVWALPPTLTNGDADKDKYIAIGESDRMTLKFVKVAAKKADEKKPEEKKAEPKKDAPGAAPAKPAK